MFEMADIFVVLVNTQMTVYIMFIGQFVDLNDFVCAVSAVRRAEV
jgi:hypothetical protein